MKRFMYGSLIAAGLLAGAPAYASELKIMWYLGTDAEEQAIKDVLATYTKLNPETTFNLQIVPYDDIDNRFAQLAAAGTLPDLSKTSSMRPFIRPYLTDFAPVFGKDYLKDFVPGWAAGAKLGDQIIAAPLQVTATGMLINKSAFEKAGVDIPDIKTSWTWDEFLAKTKEVADKAAVRYPLVWDISQSRWLTMQFQYGNHIYSEDEPYKVVFDHDKATAVLDKFIGMTKTHMPPGLWSGSSSDNPKQLFTSGQAVAWMSGNWQVGGLAENASFDWQAGPTPYGTVKSSMVGGDYVIGFNTSEHVDEVNAFIKWLTTDPKAQELYTKPIMYIPANLKVPPIDYGNAKASAALQAFKEELSASPNFAATDQANPAMQYVWGPMRQSLFQATTGQITSSQAIDQIIKTAQESLTEAGQ
ncbi:ABC transporter substrate-binding protein [Rhizobium skierniewicense]|uniref:ABC transporter substrate-binding protein n=1 Tax=Rhizobium skierniewicense TaxID=984260 RepID=UPI0015734320|nr:extracellular solute-binding protein [Rhizobium skierniewicense]NTF30474.1 extracellular solute-binding protein [Rhizobium skierniewicense]